jgi:hypothetical protein
MYIPLVGTLDDTLRSSFLYMARSIVGLGC